MQRGGVGDARAYKCQLVTYQRNVEGIRKVGHVNAVALQVARDRDEESSEKEGHGNKVNEQADDEMG